MKLGTSTYAYFWHLSEKNPLPSTIEELLVKTKKIGGEVFQICDYPTIEKMSNSELNNIATTAKELEVDLELGTRGIDINHLENYLRIAEILNVKFIRTMFNAKNSQLSLDDAANLLLQIEPILKKQDVKIGIETYEQVKTKDIVNVIKRVNSPYIGVCLDPANTIAALENPKEVVDLSIPYITNLHVKDFHFVRSKGWVGFELTGCKLGEGLLDLEYILEHVRESGKSINAILELWLPFKDNINNTLKIEEDWVKTSLNFLRRKIK